jgi:hypothetical protein
VRGIVPGLRARAAQRGDERRKAIVDGSPRVGAYLEECPDEGDRTVVNGVNEARSDADGQAAVRHGLGIVDGRTQGLQVALAKGGINPAEPLRLGAAFILSRHVYRERSAFIHQDIGVFQPVREPG